MPTNVPREEEFQRDQRRVAEHDPFADHELELKLSVPPPADPFTVLGRVRATLQDAGLGPFVFDPFGYDTRRVVHYVFGVAGADGQREAFVVLNAGEVWALRHKHAHAAAPAAAGARRALDAYILDRIEVERFASTGTFPAFLSFADGVLREHRASPAYLGSFVREAACIACRHRDSGHRYAIIGDRSRLALSDGRLQQIELEYIWKREPFPRPFTLAELRDELAQLGELIVGATAAWDVSLTPTRRTKFEWVLGELERWVASPPTPAPVAAG